jgi:trk system potassium uptake protein TrkA
MLAALAKTLGARKSIAVIRRKSYIKMADHLPIASIDNRHESLSSVIISAVRYPGHASTLMIFDQIGAETLQITIPAGSPAIGVELKDLDFPRGALIGLVRRDGVKHDIFIPTGTFHFLEGDRAIVFSTLEVVDTVLEKLGANAG